MGQTLYATAIHTSRRNSLTGFLKSFAQVPAGRLLFSLAVIVVFGLTGSSTLLAQNPPPAQVCTVTDIRGGPLVGTFCGGTSSGGNCTSGNLYKCDNKTANNNCVLLQACGTGCLVTDSPQGKLTQACNTPGLKPLTVTPLNGLGGDELTVTAQLSNPHPTGVILNLNTTRGDILQGFNCGPNLPAGVNSEQFGISTPVVTVPTTVQLNADYNWVDSTGAGYELSLTPQVITLGPGGHLPPPPLLQSIIVNPTSLDPGGIGFVHATLAHIAPAGGTTVQLTSSDPSIASIITSPFVGGGCLSDLGAETIQINHSVPKPEVVTISAVTGAAGQAPIAEPLTVTAGCLKNGCSGGPSCGTAVPDGCGGVVDFNCACTNGGLEGEVCGPNGTCIEAPPTFGVNHLTLSPSSVVGGGTSLATLTSNLPAPAGGGVVALFSDNPIVTVPPAVTIPAGSTFTTFTLTTGRLQTGSVTTVIHADDSTEATASITVVASAACTPRSCASQGKNCGSVSDGCGGTLTCGACSGTQSCGGGGVPNVCGGAAGNTATLSVTVGGGGGDITSVPSSALKASSGHPSSGVFNIGTSITLKTSDGHGAVWSGACSSNGAAAQSCTFTFTGAASVSAANK